MRKLLICLAFVLLATGPVSAQTSDCGNGVPCGPIPWRLPVLPNLPSPSPMPTIAATSSSINPGAPTNTPAPISTPTPLSLDVTSIQSNLNLIGTMAAQSPSLMTTSTPLGLADNLLSNGNCTTWSGSFPTNLPTGWTAITTQTSNEYVDQVGSACRLVRTSSNNMGIYQTVLTAGQSYTGSINVLNVTTGGIRIFVGNLGGTLVSTLSTTGTHAFSFTAPSGQPGNFQIYTLSSATNVTFSSVVVRPANSVTSSLSSNAGMFFSYVRGLNGNSFGPLAPLIVLATISMVLVFTVKISTFILPLLAALFGIIRKVVSVILEFLPL